ncbi:MAG: DUF4037 domain-containing protein [Clostridia bacterium]|nr:DUF4037 domain-containing protein [Clostridia bacterium]
MKGLELSRLFYEEYGIPLLREFPQEAPHIAVGLCGSGSECFGYDDELSTDHDFEPGFCLFLPDEEIIDSRTAFRLERAYAKLPRVYLGYHRSTLSPVGGNRHGVIRLADFLTDKTGTPDGRLSLQGWFSVPEQSLAEVINGRLFRDDSGRFTAVRETLSYLPEDVRLKKLAGHLLLMGQAGQYNYRRCVTRGETAAAQLAVTEFVKSALHTVFLLNREYLPYYKWQFRALRELPRLAELYTPLERLLTTGNTPAEAEEKAALIEAVCGAVADELRRQGVSQRTDNEAERLAYETNEHVADPTLRNLHILWGV